MLIPIRHENMEARRWPVITIGLIVLNTVIFLITNSAMEREAPEVGSTKVHIIVLAAAHPELNMSDQEQKLVDAFKQDYPAEWSRLQSPMHQLVDGWDAKMRLQEDRQQLQEEMDSLGAKYAELGATSIQEQYAFTPAHKRAITYLTANFLHGGWLHLIGNMWFLWLTIEDEAGAESRRGYVERNSIALLSNFNKPALDPPSQGWLGHHSDRERVRKSGLWNQNHVEEDCDPAFLDTLDRFVSGVSHVA